MLYRTIVVAYWGVPDMPVIRTPEMLSWLLTHRAPCFQHTRHLLIWRPLLDVRALIDACPKLEDLSYCARQLGDVEPVPFAGCTLKRLQCSVWAYNMYCLPGLEGWPSMQTLTHVSLCFDGRLRNRTDTWDWLASMPSLTHLALGYYDRLCEEDLQRLFPRLQYLVVVRQQSKWAPRLPPMSDYTSDPRVVGWTTYDTSDRGQDWQFGHVLGDDMWTRAEQVVAARMRGESTEEPVCLVDWQLEFQLASSSSP
jgi:hypothetical protein